jgi:hypothetical protein
MSDITYEQRRGQIENYFDRTAAAAWATLTSDAPVGVFVPPCVQGAIKCAPPWSLGWAKTSRGNAFWMRVAELALWPLKRPD